MQNNGLRAQCWQQISRAAANTSPDQWQILLSINDAYFSRSMVRTSLDQRCVVLSCNGGLRWSAFRARAEEGAGGLAQCQPSCHIIVARMRCNCRNVKERWCAARTFLANAQPIHSVALSAANRHDSCKDGRESGAGRAAIFRSTRCCLCVSGCLGMMTAFSLQFCKSRPRHDEGCTLQHSAGAG